MEEEKVLKPENKPENKKKKSAIKYTIYIVLVILVTGIAILISMWGKFDTVFSMLGSANVTWLLIMFVVMFVSILIRALILFFFARLYSRDYKYHQALAVEQIGDFYSAVTPGASGGEVMEAYIFQKQGLQISSAVSMLAMYSIIYQAVLSVFGIVSFIVKYDFLNQIGSVNINLGFVEFNLSIWALTIIGFLLNVGVILIVFLMSYWKGFHKFIMGPCVTLCNKIKIVKNPTKTRENLKIHVENFKIELKRLLTNAPFTILVTLFFVLLLIVRFSLPYFAGLTLHNESTTANFWDSVFLSNYHQMVTGIIPIPGAAGVSEYFFIELFVNKNNPSLGFYYISGSDPYVASSALGSAAMLLWRTISFTFPLIVAGFVTAFYRTGSGKHSARFDDQEVVENRKTMIEMKRETISARQNELDNMIHTQSLTKDAVYRRINVIHNKDEKVHDPLRKDDSIRDIDVTKDDD